MIARTAVNLNVMNTVVDRFFDVLGYERKKPPQLTRIVIIRVPDSPTLVPVRAQQSRQLPTRRYRY